MQNKKPSKQIYSLMIVAAAVILCALIFKNGNPFSKKADEEKIIAPSPLVEGSQIAIEELKDTDADGLYDWEETLRGTDTRKADSDNDGTSDGDEVKQERNPLVPGPSDSAREPTDASAIAQQTAVAKRDINTQKTVSSELSKNLLTRLMYLKDSDALTPENKESLVKDLTAFTMESFTYKKYTKDSMLILENPSINDIKVYASNFATIQVDLISNIANKGDSIVADITVLSQIYRDSAKKLSEIAIPKVLADIHLNVVNNYSIVSRSLETFKDDSDPVKKAVSIGAYQNAEASQEQALTIIANYFKQNDIMFTSDQVGDYWNNF